jgi:general L-amino acid transport system substrate-binding protein
MKFEINSDLNSAFEAGKCDVITGDISGLYSKRLKMKEPEKYAILSDIISKEPLAPAVRDDDSEWFNIAKWVRNALITAEELNITSSNVDEVKKSRIEPESRRVLGVEGRMCQNLSLDSNCFYRAIKQVGNYQEIFERNVGTKSSLLIERGLNSLWNQGGILYSPPFR